MTWRVRTTNADGLTGIEFSNDGRSLMSIEWAETSSAEDIAAYLRELADWLEAECP